MNEPLAEGSTNNKQEHTNRIDTIIDKKSKQSYTQNKGGEYYLAIFVAVVEENVSQKMLIFYVH
jgi:hypothetical protein